MTIRSETITILTEAMMKMRPDQTPWEIASAAMKQSGLRRAVWATFSPQQKTRIIEVARRAAKPLKEVGLAPPAAIRDAALEAVEGGEGK